MFNRGWKFDMLNHTDQFDKQLSALMVIFMMFAFALSSFALGGPGSFNILVLIYSMIAAFSFFNLEYVRDFDAI